MAHKLLGSASNGEHAPRRPTPLVAEAARRVAAAADEQARRGGIDRRSFLRSSMGAAATLFTLAACSKEERAADGDGAPAGTFDVPPEATTDTTAAGEVLAPEVGEVVVDVQTHFLDPDDGFGGGFPQSACGAAQCFTIDTWADLVLGASDTSAVVLSALPIVDDDHPMSIEKMETARRLVESLCGDGRVLLQGEAFPQVGDLAASLEAMSGLNDAHAIVAWKTYTHLGRGYSFTDEVGEAFLGHVEQLADTAGGPRVVAVHKGLGASPDDLGPGAAAHPGLTFLAYHSGYESANVEGPFAEDGLGVDRLIRSLRDAGVGPTGNVYCELGTTWFNVLTDPDQAAHTLGKLLSFLGPERILWGTDSIWYGSPQDQIEAFRAFEISAEAQERFGYPALTPEVKRGILGGNAARLHGLDLAAVAAPCRFTTEEREAAREEAYGRLGGIGEQLLGPRTAREARRTFARDHPWFR